MNIFSIVKGANQCSVQIARGPARIATKSYVLTVSDAHPIKVMAVSVMIVPLVPWKQWIRTSNKSKKGEAGENGANRVVTT